MSSVDVDRFMWRRGDAIGTDRAEHNRRRVIDLAAHDPLIGVHVDAWRGGRLTWEEMLIGIVVELDRVMRTQRSILEAQTRTASNIRMAMDLADKPEA